MKYPKIPLAQTIVALCKAKGIKHIVISPGSRNAPLTIGFTHDSFFKCYSIVDERCAAFFALGIAQNIQYPVALVCTSGSALLNYFPAIAEAFYSNIPLVVLSADRPKHLVDIGDGQTINQKQVYGSHVLQATNLKLDLNESQYELTDEIPIMKSIENKLEKFLGLQQSILEENSIKINRTLNKAIIDFGPVHINIPFSEPLYDTLEQPSVNPKDIKPEINVKKTNTEDLNQLVNIWNSAKRKLVLVGVNLPNTIHQQWLDVLANDDSVIVFTETTSNLYHNEFFPSIDQIIAPLSEDQFKSLQPDVLLTFGGMVISKKVKAFLRAFQPKHHWHSDPKKANDTFFCLSKHLIGNTNTFLEQFLPKTKSIPSSYKPFWKSVRNHRLVKHSEYLNTIDYSDFKVFGIILKSIPNNYILQVGNSSAIRYLQLFSLNNTLNVFCNRGTSGIDGSTSTAIGYASVSKQPVIFITGDLSFFYDSNALWNNDIPNSFRIIIINNQGGGIFRILPGHKNSENFDTYFETKHQLTAENLCKMYGIDYLSAKNLNQLSDTITDFYTDNDKPKLLEIFTPSTLNDEVLLNYFKFIA
ncbi:2-succinyl-5-enolpyruvyl-6-hydroxy-3-cyclohexene-1-carboxylic-acid synthase [Ichthyenterobacterium sp. W332]|uniref:2-succinyl-5-enolpyruvyl-6-hydroxy-3-cyclohexene-1-carboxylate synthase n=1 Tax=Microcosmobacter mediterraneus TaxID=3075607 RepID=A0ABU2YMM6_9FLAO|nr:2-succinyl-5-enolpyruvyl-6-hydroxy-3-cyclohexene-1-carboxylic-acid synthase [Ichthyenterobacterium sp. W332]MDT0559417.1 2-succinyl-5-enolpyruvyl-6-hydroxy-3-cyclohexene-1-carboxylic-acid synthase [Ichthyenterobacterium sp. W332]